MAGSVSGGCIEGAVADAAQQTMQTGAPATARFRRHQRARLGGRPRLRRQAEGVRGEAGDDAGPARPAAPGAARRKRPVVLATRLPGGEQMLLPDDDAPPALAEAAADALRRTIASGTVRGRRRDLVPARLQPAAAPGRGRRGAYRPGAGADGGPARLRRHRGRSAPLLRHRRAVPRRRPSAPTGRTRRMDALAPG